MRRWLTGVLAAVLLMGGCTPQPYQGERRDLHGQLQPQPVSPPKAPALGRSAAALGPEEPYLPLVQPPEVRRVWMTAHLNASGDLVAGHWVYLMLTPSQWFLRGYEGPTDFALQVPAAPVAGEAARGGSERDD